jgi:hypothetical protein
MDSSDPVSRTGYVSQLRVHPESRPRYFQISVYEDVEDLRRAARRFSRKRREDMDFAEAGGVFHPATTCWGETTDNSWAVRWDPYAGHLRLHNGQTNPETIAHEAIHVACAMWRYETNLRVPDTGAIAILGEDADITMGVVNLGENNHDLVEERFAYLVGNIVDGICIILEEMRR